MISQDVIKSTAHYDSTLRYVVGGILIFNNNFYIADKVTTKILIAFSPVNKALRFKFKHN